LQHINWLNSNTLICCSSTHPDVITVDGYLNGHRAHMINDSGASGNFITQKYINDDGRETLTSNVNYTHPKTVNLQMDQQLKQIK